MFRGPPESELDIIPDMIERSSRNLLDLSGRVFLVPEELKPNESFVSRPAGVNATIAAELHGKYDDLLRESPHTRKKRRRRVRSQLLGAKTRALISQNPVESKATHLRRIQS